MAPKGGGSTHQVAERVGAAPRQKRRPQPERGDNRVIDLQEANMPVRSDCGSSFAISQNRKMLGSKNIHSVYTQQSQSTAELRIAFRGSHLCNLCRRHASEPSNKQSKEPASELRVAVACVRVQFIFNTLSTLSMLRER